MRILFVSDTDLCRGPMARGVSEFLARKENVYDMVFDSCGISATGGMPAIVEVIGFLKRERINILSHRSKPLTPTICDNADVIFCMTETIAKKARTTVGEYYAPKVIALCDGVDLATKNPDVLPPNSESIESIRRTFALLKAALGRMIRTLEEPDACPEFFGVKSVKKRMRPGQGGAGPRATKSTIDPKIRLFLSNFIFDYVERCFESPSTTQIQEAVTGAGQEVSAMELGEILRQDLHGFVRLDGDGFWSVVPGSTQKRKEKAKADARARAEQQQRQAPPPPPKKEPDREEKLTMEGAYDILAVKPEMAKADVQKSYRALLQRYHPDKFHDDPEFAEMASAKTRRINEAWSMIKDQLAD